MRLATWNVNSLRARLDRVQAWLERSDVDVVALQETKMRDEQFPAAVFEAMGYQVAHVGHSQWNGVAILSRMGLDDVRAGFEGMPPWGEPPEAEARALGAVCGGVRVWSLYVPNGRALDDPHLEYKLHWLAALRDAGRSRLAAEPDAQIALVGDWNIAPRDEDVWSMAAFEGSTHVSPRERAAFQAVVDAGYADVVRPDNPGPGTFTYWDYQRLRFAHREGMRIDFVLASPALAARVKGSTIDRQERKGKGASDHAPVVVDLCNDHGRSTTRRPFEACFVDHGSPAAEPGTAHWPPQTARQDLDQHEPVRGSQGTTLATADRRWSSAMTTRPTLRPHTRHTPSQTRRCHTKIDDSTRHDGRSGLALCPENPIWSKH